MSDFIYNNFGKFLGIIFIALFAGMVYVDYQSIKKEPSLYQAWCKANNNTNITFVEWQELKRNHLLPGQSKSTYVPVVVPVVTR